MITYRGFSTRHSPKKYSLTDYQLAKQDLLNYFNIRKGEKLMQPNFGTIVKQVVFESMTQDVIASVQQNINDAINKW